MTRKELEAENEAYRRKLDELEAEIAYQERRRSAVGNRWLEAFVAETRKDVQAAREAAAAESQPVPASERRKRAYGAFL